MKTVEVVSAPPTKGFQDLEYIDFDVIREKWNKYKLEDGSILKTKFVLINVVMERKLDEIVEELSQKITKSRGKVDVKIGLGMQSRNVIGVEAPRRLRGEPTSKTYKPEELLASVVKEDLDFEVLEERWNIYKLKNGITIKIKNAPVTIRRTSKFDNRGTPIYLVDSVADIKVDLPKRIKEKLKIKQR